MDDVVLQRGLPANLDAEKFVLGSILLDDAYYIQAAGALQVDDFSIEKHRRIFSRMGEIYDRGGEIDRVTLANELMNRKQLESCDGLTYLSSLDDGLPQTFNIDSYIRIVKDKATGRKGILACQNVIDRFCVGSEDTDDILTSWNETSLRLGAEQIKSGLLTPKQIIGQFPGGLNAFLDPSRGASGLKVGLTKFDEMTGGLQEGELIILAGRPSMGKSALAQNMAQYVVLKLEQPAAIFSLEMSAASVLRRMACATARVDLHKQRTGYMNSDERNRLQVATSQLARAPLLIDDSPALTMMDIHAKVKRAEAEQGRHFALVAVDYLQLMTGRGRSENRNQEISSISRGLKVMAKELKVPVLALSQLSRAPDTRAGDHRPVLSDLRESGAIEQDADLVAFVYREEFYKREQEHLKGLAELIVAKQRNGDTGKIDLVFLKHLTKFENRAEDLPEDEPPMWRAADAGGSLPYADN